MAFASFALLAGCSDDAIRVVATGSGFATGEVTRIFVEARDANGLKIAADAPALAPGARLPASVEIAVPYLGDVRSVVVELRGKREIYARNEYPVQEGLDGLVELKVPLSRGDFLQGCADLDADGSGEGPDCAAPDCDDTEPAASPGREETCGDGVDNDCNGVIEDGCACEPGAIIDCRSFARGAVGFGRCRAGRLTCDDDRTYGACEDEVVPTSEGAGERGIDDDCDGLFDEAEACVEGELAPCYEGPRGTAGVGLCRGGIRTCAGGVFGECEGAVLPAEEICGTELDESCDGRTDEETCSSGPVVFSLGEDLAGFTTTGTALDPQPCEGERALSMAGAEIAFTRADLSLGGHSFASIALTVGLRPDLGGLEIAYGTADGPGELGMSAELALDASAECGDADFIEVDAPWIETETITSLSVTLKCADGTDCTGQPLVLRTIELF